MSKLLGDHITDTFELADYFAYLDDLRESGVTNMYGSGPYLHRVYGLSKDASDAVVRAWMHTFSHNKTPVERAEKALAEKAA